MSARGKHSNVVSDSQLQPGQFFGDIRTRHSLSGLLFSELQYQARRKLPKHSHQLAYFCLLIRGAGEEFYSRRTYRYKPVTITFCPPGVEHRVEIGNQGGHFFSIELDAGWMARLEQYGGAPDAIVDCQGGDLNWLALRILREIKAPRSCSALAVEGLIMTMLAELVSVRTLNESRPPRWLCQAVDRLRAEFNQELTIERIATDVGVHPFHFSKVFRRFHGQTVGEFVKRLRVQFSCRQLFDPDVELASVALSAGFGDQSHFTRAFKDLTGMTPGAFRAAIKSGRNIELAFLNT